MKNLKIFCLVLFCLTINLYAANERNIDEIGPIDVFLEQGAQICSGDTKEFLIKRLGSPNRQLQRLKPNLYVEKSQYKQFVFYYDDLTICFNEMFVGNTKKIGILFIETYSNRFLNSQYKLIGADFKNVTSFFGTNFKRIDSKSISYQNNYGTDSIIFTFSNKKLIKIRWVFYDG